MRKTLRSGAYRFELVGREESVLAFRDLPEAIDYLGRFKDNSNQVNILRDVVASYFPNAHRMKVEEVIEKFGGLLINRQVTILSKYELAGGGQVEETPATQAQAAKGPTPAKKSWIEINLIDSDGNPVPGERYKIKLPDGSIEEGNLDAFGHAEHYGINPGSCEVCFPNLDTDNWAHV